MPGRCIIKNIPIVLFKLERFNDIREIAGL